MNYKEKISLIKEANNKIRVLIEKKREIRNQYNDEKNNAFLSRL